MEFVQGQTYRRRDLHAEYGGQQQGGISTPAAHPLLLLFSGESGQQFGYADVWVDGVYEYTGEGQRGDMQMIRGNRAILDHASNGKDLHLFEVAKPDTMVTYVGQMVCAGHKTRPAPDLDAVMRQVIVFDLVPVDGASAEAAPVEQHPQLAGFWAMPLAELLALAATRPPASNDPKVTKRNTYERSEAVRVYVLRRAGETCEGCGATAPFVTADGRPYLEPHHIRRRSDGGPDDPAWVAGVCPNCHRRAHHARDREVYNAQLKAAVDGKAVRS